MAWTAPHPSRLASTDVLTGTPGANIVRVKRWDDLQILRLIDELEGGETAALTSGFALMQRARPGVHSTTNGTSGPSPESSSWPGMPDS